LHCASPAGVFGNEFRTRSRLVTWLWLTHLQTCLGVNMKID
jgi:hypothetical protein